MRRKQHQQTRYQVTVVMDEELAQQLEQTMMSYGLESKGQAAAALIKAGLSATSSDAFLSSVLQQTMREFRVNESTALAEFYEYRAKLLREAR